MPKLPRCGHNAHYHDYLLAELPSQFELALDVGCGTGEFARRLAARAGAVTGIDVSDQMIAQAAVSGSQPDNLAWVQGDILSLDLPTGGYDVVSAIASLHHMPLGPALARLSELVRPGGMLVILGLYSPVTFTDYALSALAMAADPLGWRRQTDPRMPVRDPTSTLAEVKQAAAVHLPGSRIRRHLLYRYSLIWRHPS
jgi:ubiquinone/menaquinone biosynthesis C-methylase UbiE